MPNAEVFLSSFATVLCVAAATTLLFQRLRLPVLTGYIIAGLIIGPHVPIAIVADEGTVEMMSQLGVILLMFSTGLDLDVRTVARLGTTGGLIAALEVGVLFSLGYGAAHLFGWSAQASLFTGAIVCISSTTVVAKTFAEQAVTSKIRELVYSVLIMEDLIAILLLATLTTWSGGHSPSPAQLALTAMRLLAFLGGCLLVGLLLVPRFVRAVVKFDRSETTVIAAIGICFASALLARRFGYSVALGAFIAGLCVGASGHAHKIASLVSPIRDVFVAIFFVAVGMQIDPRMLVEHWRPITALVAVVLIGKTFAVSLGAFLVGAGVRPSVQAGLSLAQIGELSFVIAALGVSTHATDRSFYPIVVAVSTATAFATPWLIRASGPMARIVDRKLPRRVQMFAALYGSWVERLRASAGASRSRTIRLGKFLVLDTCCVLATIIATSLWYREIGALVGQMIRLSPTISQLIVITAAAVLALPLVLGMVRLSRDLGLTLAMEALPAPGAERVDLAAAPRRVFVLTLQLTCILAVGIPLMAITQVFVPSSAGVMVLLVVVLVAGVFFWRSAADLDGHVRAGAQALAEMLGSSASPPATSAAIDELVAGIGAPTAVTLSAGSAAIGETLGRLNLRGSTGATVLAIRRLGGDLIIPTATEALREGDVLALAGSRDSIDAARELLVGGTAAS